MALIKRTAEKALTDASTHDTKAADLEAKATEADTTAHRLDADSMETLADDPTQAEGISSKIDAQKRLARAYRAKAAGHRTKAEDARREALELEAAELESRAAKLDAQADKVVAKVAAALAVLEEADGGAEWCRVDQAHVWGPPIDRADAIVEDHRTESTQQQRAEGGTATAIRKQAEALRLRARHNRYFLEHGQLAPDPQDLGAPREHPLAHLTGQYLPTVEDFTTELLARMSGARVGETVDA